MPLDLRTASELTDHHRKSLRCELVISRTLKYRNEDGSLKDDLDIPRWAWIIGGVIITFLATWWWCEWTLRTVVITASIFFFPLAALLAGIGYLFQGKPRAEAFCEDLIRRIGDSAPVRWLDDTPLSRIARIREEVDLIEDAELVALVSLDAKRRAKTAPEKTISSSSGGLALVVLLLGCCVLNPNRAEHLAELLATQPKAQDVKSADDIIYKSIGIASFTFLSADLPSRFNPSDIENALSIGILNNVWRLKVPK